MEKIIGIFTKKITAADFKNMYGLKIPTGGGGMTYIDAAGVDSNNLEQFLEYGKSKATNFEIDSRKIHTISAIVLGKNIYEDLEFAPRNKRKNYKISRQTLKDRHPAWHPNNGFPTPHSVDGRVIEESCEFITEHLFVYIIKTNDGKYYASFFDSRELPNGWPNIPELNSIMAERATVSNLSKYNYEFVNDSLCPFKTINPITKPTAGASGPVTSTIIEDKIDYEKIKVEKHQIPNIPTNNNNNHKKIRIGIKRNRELEQKNKNCIGKIGEKIVFMIERKKLNDCGLPELANKIEWSSETKGDGLGYDIQSFNKDKSIMYIEVKSTMGDETTPFDISSNEIEFSKENPDSFYIYRLYNITGSSEKIDYYIIHGDIATQCDLNPTSYTATPHVN